MPADLLPLIVGFGLVFALGTGIGCALGVFLTTSILLTAIIRTFGYAQWKELQKELTRVSVEDVLTFSINKSKQY